VILFDFVLFGKSLCDYCEKVHFFVLMFVMN